MKVLVDESVLIGIADAIRSKLGTSGGYKPLQMASAISSIPNYPEPTGTISITQNGTANVKDYASASVSVANTYSSGDEGKVVSSGALVSQSARSSNITSNGTYDTTLNNSVTVSISSITSANGLSF